MTKNEIMRPKKFKIKKNRAEKFTKNIKVTTLDIQKLRKFQSSV